MRRVRCVRRKRSQHCGSKGSRSIFIANAHIGMGGAQKVYDEMSEREENGKQAAAQKLLDKKTQEENIHIDTRQSAKAGTSSLSPNKSPYPRSRTNREPEQFCILELYSIATMTTCSMTHEKYLSVSCGDGYK
ncbi:hypothetical protein PHJA_002152000 [Phtheirospermum japonicum]|uniref:Uncharacterized protein n=1 Tax=Phtheirospermum japonicum TaxID=374723 RepID=A0A830CM93_9LAMI|nr:hypothetical protein PHJA_002152000 [Phtheirospermum japonicum]